MSSLVSEATLRAEADVVAICLEWPSCLELVRLDPKHFHDPRYRLLFAVMRACQADAEPVTETTLARRLEREAGGGHALAALSEHLVNDAPITGDNVEHLAGIVRDGWVARGVYEAAGEVVGAFRERATGDELLTMAMQAISSLETEQPDEAMRVRDLMRQRYKELVAQLEARERGEPASTGILTGIQAFDLKTGGLQVGIVTLLASRPSMGKTSVGTTIADNVSEMGVGVHDFVLEDFRSRFADRILSRRSRVPAESIRGLNFSVQDLHALRHAASSLTEERHWLIDDRSGISAEEVVRSVRRARRRNKTRVVIVDYVQLLTGQRGESKQERLDRSINVLADAAKRDEMAYVVMSQMNRGSQGRDDKRPTLPDLRGAGELEERAKCVIGLHRPAYYGEVMQGPYGEELPVPDDMLEMLVLKQSDGETGTVVVNWDAKTMRVW